MDPRHLLLVTVGAVLSLLAAVPATLLVVADEPGVQAASVTAATIDERIDNPGSTTTIPTTTTHGGRPRAFVLHIPDGLLAPAPLVVALHARSHTTDKVREQTQLEALADEQGFVVAFPSGAAGSWNAGGCCRPGSVDKVDDVAFLDEVIALTRARTAIDPARIGLTGTSNGAMMALRYACERSGVVAAAAVVSTAYVTACTPPDPVDVLVLHGADDAVVPLAGGRNTSLDVTFPPVEASLAPLRSAGGDVQLTVLPGVGHTWMTEEQDGVDASREVWEWLRDHPRRA